MSAEINTDAGKPISNTASSVETTTASKTCGQWRGTTKDCDEWLSSQNWCRSRSADRFIACRSETLDLRASSSGKICTENQHCSDLTENLPTSADYGSLDVVPSGLSPASPPTVTLSRCDFGQGTQDLYESCKGARGNNVTFDDLDRNLIQFMSTGVQFSDEELVQDASEQLPTVNNIFKEKICICDADDDDEVTKAPSTSAAECQVSSAGNFNRNCFNIMQQDDGAFDVETYLAKTDGISKDKTKEDLRETSYLDVKGKISKDRNKEKGSPVHCGPSRLPRKGRKSPTDKKKKGNTWFSVLSPSYKFRREEFKRLFKDIPCSEKLIVDYSCALQKDILVHGRVYISQSFLSFHANIFRWATVLRIPLKEIVKLTKEKTAKVIPNAIQVITKDDKFFFTSFAARDKMFVVLDRIWKTCLSNQVLTRIELWQWIHYSYGDELGLTSGDDDYTPLSLEEKLQFQLQLPRGEKSNQMSENPDIPDNSKEPVDGYLLPAGKAQNLLSLCDTLSMPSTEDQHSPSIGKKTRMDDLVDESASLPSPQLSNHKERVSSLLDASTDINSDEEEVDRCSEHDHFPLQVIDEILNIPVDVVFAHCFTDSALYHDFVTAKKTFDVVLPPWPEEPDASGIKARNITYTLSLNYAIGPKVSPSKEQQIMYPESQPGQFYLIDTECINGGIPYGENFYVVNRYCMSKISNTRCRLRITSQIKYRKSVWGIVKNFIEKNASAGIIESFNIMADLLRQESNSRHSQSTGIRPCNLARKKVLRRKRTSNRTAAGSATPPDAKGLNSSRLGTPIKHRLSKAILTKLRDEWHFQLTSDALVKVICAILLILVMFNATLFCKLWTLESSTSRLVHSKLPHFDASAIKEPPKSNQEWLNLLDHQRYLHESEISHWKEILSTSIELLDQMTHTLAELRSSLDEQSAYKHDNKWEKKSNAPS